MVVGRLVSFCEGLFSGAMLNFREGIHGILEVEMARFRGDLNVNLSRSSFPGWMIVGAFLFRRCIHPSLQQNVKGFASEPS